MDGISTRRRHRVAFHWMAIGASLTIALTAGCTDQSGKNFVATTISGGTTASASPSDRATSPTAADSGSASLSVQPPSGLLTGAVFGSDRHRVAYGVIDMQTGSYTAFKEFQTAQATFWDPKYAISPDWRRMGATAVVDNQVHAGWVDESGKFTDVTALLLKGSAQAGDFAKPVVQTVVGFDRMGFLYIQDETDKDENGSLILRVQVEKPSKAVEYARISRDQGGIWEYSHYWNRNRDLVPIPDGVETCSNVASDNDFAWLDDIRYVTAQFHGSQLLIWSSLTTMCPWETGGKQYESKMLEESDYKVSDPYVNPAGDSIAFYSDTLNFHGFYTVPATGGDPTRTGVTREIAQQYTIIRWI